MIAPVLTLLGVALGLVAIGTVIGRSILVLVDRDDRPLSVATLLGIAVIVCWLCLVALLIPPGSWTAVASLGVGSAGLAGWAGARAGQRALPTAAQWRTFGGALVAGGAALVPFAVLMASARSTAFVHLDTNNDGFFFTAAPRWLMDHRGVGSSGLRPGGSPGVELLGSVWDRYQEMSLRYGADALIAATARVSGIDPLDLWLPITASFAGLVGVAAHRVAEALGRAEAWAVVAGATVATSTLALSAVTQQHTPTILAMALVLVLFAEVEHSGTERQRPTPPVVLALLATAVLASYGELLILTGLPLAVLVAVRWRRGDRAWRRWAAAAAWSAAIGAPTWFRAARGAGAVNIPKGYVSPYGPAVPGFAALRNVLVGPADLTASFSSTSWASGIMLFVLLVTVVAGLVAVVRMGPARPWWLSLIVVAAAGWWWLGRNQESGYPQTRWVEWAMPLLLLGSLLGWATLADRLRGTAPTDPGRAGASRSVATSMLVAATVALALPGVLSITRLHDVPARRVDGAFTDAATWVESRDPTGASTTVWAADYFTNLWSPYVLRSAPDTSYLSIYRDYYAVDHYGSLHHRRWLLLDRAALDASSLAANSIVATNARFALVDLDAGPAQLTVEPRYDGRWSRGTGVVTVDLDATSATCRAGAKVVRCP